MAEKREYNINDPADLAAKIINILYKKKAHDIKLLRVTDQTIIADYFVIVTGNCRDQPDGLIDRQCLGQRFVLAGGVDVFGRIGGDDVFFKQPQEETAPCREFPADGAW